MESSETRVPKGHRLAIHQLCSVLLYFPKPGSHCQSLGLLAVWFAGLSGCPLAERVVETPGVKGLKVRACSVGGSLLVGSSAAVTGNFALT